MYREVLPRARQYIGEAAAFNIMPRWMTDEDMYRHFLFLLLTASVRRGKELQFCLQKFKEGDGNILVSVLDQCISDKDIGFERETLEKLIALRRDIDKYIVLL